MNSGWLVKTFVKRPKKGNPEMPENMVGETGFEPATSCSQSQQLPNDFNGESVKQGDFGRNGINTLLDGCKTNQPPQAIPGAEEFGG